MATFEEVQDALQLSVLRALVKYSGGSVRNMGSKAKRINTPANSVIINSHFTKGNKAIYKPLSPRYLARKTRKVGKKPILVYSGEMKKSIVGQGYIYAIGKERFKIAYPKAKPYAKKHAAGSPLKGGLPRRHPTKPTAQDKVKFKQALQNSLKTTLAALSKTRYKPSPAVV